MIQQCIAGNKASAPNVLRFTRAALIDQESAQADTSRQKRPDSAGRLERSVGWRGSALDQTPHRAGS